MDGYLPNAFLAKKLMMEGLLDDEDIDKDKLIRPAQSVLRATNKTEKSKEEETAPPKIKEEPPNIVVTCNVQDNKSVVTSETPKRKSSDIDTPKKKSPDFNKTQKRKLSETIETNSVDLTESDIQKNIPGDTSDVQKKRLSDASEESDTVVIIKQEESLQSGDRKIETNVMDESKESEKTLEVPPVKKRKASPIIFDTDKVEKTAERVRERTQSASSDSHVIVTTGANTHKYDAVPTCKFIVFFILIFRLNQI